MSNPTLQSWSDTTINQKIQINTGAILHYGDSLHYGALR